MTSHSTKPTHSPLTAAVIIGCAFFYFLIFAQFGFLHHLTMLETKTNLIELILGFMGVGGIIGSITTARRFEIQHANNWLVAGFVGCGLSAIVAIIAISIWLQFLVALLVGLFLGSLTVAIVPLARALVSQNRIGLYISLGVGGAYFLSNVPQLFKRTGEDHCLLGAIACCIGVVATLSFARIHKDALSAQTVTQKTHDCLFRTSGVLTITGMFLALIWLDSAAFYLIQESSQLKAISWTTDAQLWLNACFHFLFALVGGWCLDRGWLFALLVASFALLVTGTWLLKDSSGTLSLVYTELYVAGVSLYSSGLVAYGALAPENKEFWSIRARAGVVFSVGGWLGSGLGIGMARDLNKVPISFMVIVAGFVLFCSFITWSTASSRKQS